MDEAKNTEIEALILSFIEKYKNNNRVYYLINPEYVLGNNNFDINQKYFTINDKEYIDFYFTFLNQHFSNLIRYNFEQNKNKFNFLIHPIKNIPNFDSLFIEKFYKKQLKTKNYLQNNITVWAKIFFLELYNKDIDINNSTFKIMHQTLSKSFSKPSLFLEHLKKLESSYLNNLTSSKDKLIKISKFYSDLNDFYKISDTENLKKYNEQINASLKKIHSHIIKELKASDLEKVNEQIKNLELLNHYNVIPNENILIDEIKKGILQNYGQLKFINKLNFSKELLEKHNLLDQVKILLKKKKFFFDDCVKTGSYSMKPSFVTFCKLIILDKEGFLSFFDEKNKQNLLNKGFLNAKTFNDVQKILTTETTLETLNSIFSLSNYNSYKFDKENKKFMIKNATVTKENLNKIILEEPLENKPINNIKKNKI